MEAFVFFPYITWSQLIADSHHLTFMETLYYAFKPFKYVEICRSSSHSLIVCEAAVSVGIVSAFGPLLSVATSQPMDAISLSWSVCVL